MNSPIVIRRVDAQGPEALSLLREAAAEAHALYPELQSPDAPWPTNDPTIPRGVYLIADLDGRAVGCGALRPIDDASVEVRRLFVRRDARRLGIARALVAALEREARANGFATMRLETGYRQRAAIALYESLGFVRIAPFGPYAGDPTSVCFERAVDAVR